MYGQVQKTKKGIRFRAITTLFLAFLLSVGPSASASSVIADANSTSSTIKSAKTLVPVGHTVGIKLFSRGVLVVKLAEGGTPAKDGGLQTGDVILNCGPDPVTSTEQFQELLQKSGGNPTDLQIKREGKNLEISVAPEENEQGQYAIGAWVRDSMAGIGTVTFYDPSTGVFGALGHGITDLDTAQLMPFSSGSILPSYVKAVKRGETGHAGELRGDFDLNSELGVLSANTDCGIFGQLSTDISNSPEYFQGDAFPVAQAEEVHTGPAIIRSNIKGDAVQEYQVEILRISQDASDGRDLVLSVTDPALLEQTGGIVQGMSGSPILQDGKFIGAVTHVLLNDPSKGYGILLQTMLEAN